MKTHLIEIARYFFRLGCLGFGGPLAIINHMYEDLVKERKWISESEFSTVFPMIKSLPGPVAFQMGIYLCFKRAGILGAIIGAFGLVAPAFVMILIAFQLVTKEEHIHMVRSLLEVLSIVALALILQSWWNLFRPFKKRHDILFGMVVTIVLFHFQISEVLMIFSSGLLFIAKKKYFGNTKFSTVILAGLIPLSVEFESLLGKLTWIGFKAGALVFGTGLAIFPLLQSDVVNTYKWVTQKEFLMIFSLGQLTPGPVMISLAPIGYKVAGLTGALLVTVMVFLPGFLNMTTWFPRTYQYLKTKAWIGDFADGATAVVLGGILYVSYLSMLQMNTVMDFALLVAAVFVLLRFKPPSWLVFIIFGAVGSLLL